MLLELLHDERLPLFQRYFRFMLDLTAIHPFPDGNGKLAALLGDLYLLKQGIHPPYFARYKWESESDFYELAERYSNDPLRDISIFYPVAVRAYEKNTLFSLPHDNDIIASLPDVVLVKLREEVTLSIEAGDLPVGCVLTAGDTLVASHRNTIHSQKGLRFHAERNLLAQLGGVDIPAGRRVLWVTLEPCLRCAQAIMRFGVDEVVYVLYDPFGGGKALLAKAGIAVTQREEWEQSCLRQVMDFCALYPEFFAFRQFRFPLEAWQRHNLHGRDERVKTVFLHHLAPYLNRVLATTPEARQNEIRRHYLAHVDALTNLTLRECPGILSLAFVRNLHRALFPPEYRHRAMGNDGVASETASGEWRRHVLWPHYTEFSAPEDIETDLTTMLSVLHSKALLQREDALQFFLEFLVVFPFTDGNGRLAAILADVICLNNGLAPLALDRKNELFYMALMENLSRGVPIMEQLHLVDSWNKGQVGIRPSSIYDDQPSAFQTYTRRSGDKRHVVAQVFAKLADQRLNQPFVVTDIGTGMGAIADGILHGLVRREGMAFEYNYLEPSQASVDYFREHSHYASLPQLVIHTMPIEDFLLPPSDLIVVVQSIQYVPNPGETVRDIVAALKPGGLALIACNHPDSDEWRMISRLTQGYATYERLKEFLDHEQICYEEVVVESTIRISQADRDTPDGDDLLVFYFRQPAHALKPSLKEAFWDGVAELAKDGGVRIKEAFFWLWRKGSGEAGSMNNPFSPETQGQR